VDKTTIYVGDLQSKQARTRVTVTRSNAVYVPPGYILFVRERTLMAQPFDTAKLTITGDAFPIAEQVDAIYTQGYFTASQNGVVAYESGAQVQNVQMTSFDRSGKPLGTQGSPAEMHWVASSPDGKTVAFDRRDAQTGYYDIWLRNLARGTDSASPSIPGTMSIRCGLPRETNSPSTPTGAAMAPYTKRRRMASARTKP
jgi:hypothetical protein